MSTAALILALVAGEHVAATIVLIPLMLAAGLESILGYCVGCQVFGLLMRAGVIPELLHADLRQTEGGAAQDVVL